MLVPLDLLRRPVYTLIFALTGLLLLHSPATADLFINEYLAGNLSGIEDDLGKKGVSGVLKSKATRKSFLEDSVHRIRFVYTPRHTSWLNQIERWFSILVRRLLKQSSFRSLDELEAKLREFIDYFNAVLAKPFK